MKFKGLVDTRSNITCIQLEWLEQNNKKLRKIKELPLTEINIITPTE